MGEDACGYPWTECLKVSKFGSFMRGKAEKFYTSQVSSWLATQPTLAYVIEQMGAVFTVVITTQQCAELFKIRKPDGMSWHDHYLYLVAVKYATGASEALNLENIVKIASESMRPILFGQVKSYRTDYVVHARENGQWVQEMDDKLIKFKRIGNLVSHTGHAAPAGIAAQGGSVTETKRDEDHECFYCKKKDHLMRDCRKKSREDGDGTKVGFSSIHYADVSPDDWIVDSGASPR